MSEERSESFAELPNSLYNRYECDAEYILVPGGRYDFYQDQTDKEVPNLYYAKRPVTIKQYRRFISYLEGTESELLGILPKGDFDRQMAEFTRGIRGFTGYLGNEPNGWPEKLRSDSAVLLREWRQKRPDEPDFRFTQYTCRAICKPVVEVSWFGARAYCYWLALLEVAGENLPYENAAGLYRLPRTFEWNWINGFAHQGTRPEGLLHMQHCGRLWQWMEDDQVGDGSRTVRGGVWHKYHLKCRDENFFNPESTDSRIGFRVVRSQT